MSATKILTQILRSDNIPYSIVPVNNLMHIRKAFEKSLAGDVSTIFLINCGAVSDLFWLIFCVLFCFSFLSRSTTSQRFSIWKKVAMFEL